MLDLTPEEITDRFKDKYSNMGPRFAEDVEILKGMIAVHEAVSIVELLQLLDAPSEIVELVTDHIKIKMIGLCPDAVDNLKEREN